MVRTNLPASQLLKKKLLYFVLRYGRVYATAADPYHHSVGPTTTYGVGTVVSCHARTHARTRTTGPDKAWCTFLQQASLYRGGYNRFTPYWDASTGRRWADATRPLLCDWLIHWRCSTDEEIHPVFESGILPAEAKQTQAVNSGTHLLDEELL